MANSAGSTLENTVVGTLTSKGFQVVTYRDCTSKPDAYNRELLLMCLLPQMANPL